MAWDIPLIGSARRRTGLVWPSGDRIVLSSDASRVVRVTERGELWVSTMTGATPRLLVRPQKAFDVMTEGTDAVASATWSADGRHVLFSRHDSPHVESVSATGGTPSRVFSAPRGLRVANMGVHLRDGSMVLSLVRGGPTRLAGSRSQVALWRVRTDAATASPAELPHQVTEWRDGDVSVVSASADGKRVVFLGVLSQADVYIASFDQRARRLRDTPRRMTLDERDDWPCAWTLDGQAVIFSSDRNGSSDIFVRTSTPIRLTFSSLDVTRTCGLA